jgi:hypothetical protein
MYLPDDDPRRQLIAQAILYCGTFIVIAVGVVAPPLKAKPMRALITRSSWAERESLLVEACEAEVVHLCVEPDA